jgi:hypothetical protein
MRFAHEHAPKAPPRSFWILAGIFLLLLAVPVAIFNLAVDPFDFRLAPHLSLIREKIVRKDDTVLWSAGELRRIPQRALNDVTIVFCGDSRTELLTGGRFFPRILKVGNDRILSLSVGGASFDENIKILRAELPKLPHLRAVVLGAPLERIGIVESDRVDNAFRVANSPLYYVLGLGTVTYSVSLLREQEAAAGDGDTIRDRPDVDPDKLVDVSAEWLDTPANVVEANSRPDKPLAKRDVKVANQWKKKLAQADLNLIKQRLETVIAPLAEDLAKQNAKLVFYFPPLHPKVIEGFKPKVREMQKTYLSLLAKYGTVEDFSLKQPAGIVPKFSDASHVIDPVAQVILADIYQRDLASPPAGHPVAR